MHCGSVQHKAVVELTLVEVSGKAWRHSGNLLQQTPSGQIKE